MTLEVDFESDSGVMSSLMCFRAYKHVFGSEVLFFVEKESFLANKDVDRLRT